MSACSCWAFGQSEWWLPASGLFLWNHSVCLQQDHRMRQATARKVRLSEPSWESLEKSRCFSRPGFLPAVSLMAAVPTPCRVLVPAEHLGQGRAHGGSSGGLCCDGDCHAQGPLRSPQGALLVGPLCGLLLSSIALQRRRGRGQVSYSQWLMAESPTNTCWVTNCMKSLVAKYA